MTARSSVPGLGPLEAAIMAVLWDASLPLTPQEVADRADYHPVAYTTVAKVMVILVGKGLASRDRRGRAYAYEAAVSREWHLARIVRAALDAAADPGHVIALASPAARGLSLSSAVACPLGLAAGMAASTWECPPQAPLTSAFCDAPPASRAASRAAAASLSIRLAKRAISASRAASWASLTRLRGPVIRNSVCLFRSSSSWCFPGLGEPVPVASSSSIWASSASTSAISASAVCSSAAGSGTAAPPFAAAAVRGRSGAATLTITLLAVVLSARALDHVDPSVPPAPQNPGACQAAGVTHGATDDVRRLARRQERRGSTNTRLKRGNRTSVCGHAQLAEQRLEPGRGRRAAAAVALSDLREACLGELQQQPPQGRRRLDADKVGALRSAVSRHSGLRPGRRGARRL